MAWLFKVAVVLIDTVVAIVAVVAIVVVDTVTVVVVLADTFAVLIDGDGVVVAVVVWVDVDGVVVARSKLLCKGISIRPLPAPTRRLKNKIIILNTTGCLEDYLNIANQVMGICPLFRRHLNKLK